MTVGQYSRHDLLSEQTQVSRGPGRGWLIGGLSGTDRTLRNRWFVHDVMSLSFDQERLLRLSSTVQVRDGSGQWEIEQERREHQVNDPSVGGMSQEITEGSF